MSGLSPRKGGFLEAIHLYRKVPRDLTDATRLGGVLSLLCAATMAYLFLSNIAEYLSMSTSSDVALDDTGETHMRLFFNITMVSETRHTELTRRERVRSDRPHALTAARARLRLLVSQERLPCQFATVDLGDVMGTSLTNVTGEIIKFRVAPDEGHKSEFYVEDEKNVKHEEMNEMELALYKAMPENLPMLTEHEFDRFVKMNDLVLVAFGAPWCPWSQRLEPVWRKTYEELKKRPFAEHVRMGRVDCTSAAAQQLCQRQHIHAFPTIRVYRHKLLHSHENYLGDRDSKAFLDFMEESLPHKREGAGELSRGLAQKSVGGQAVEAHTLDGEGCQLTGSVRISRVPGNMRIRAASASHSFNTRVMNVSHHVDKLLFASLGETPRLRHVLPIEQRSGLLDMSYKMHQELATLKHYLKVVPFQYAFLDGETQHTYLYKANYNEYKPRKLEWYEGKADAYVDTDLVPNAAFHYDISPVMVMMAEETQSFSSFVTRICAVIGGIYTVVGLLDNVLYHTGETMKKMS